MAIVSVLYREVSIINEFGRPYNMFTWVAMLLFQSSLLLYGMYTGELKNG